MLRQARNRLLKGVTFTRGTACCGAWLIELLVSCGGRRSSHVYGISRVLVVVLALTVDQGCIRRAVLLGDATEAISATSVRLVVRVIIGHSTMLVLVLIVGCLEATRARTVVILLKLLLLLLLVELGVVVIVRVAVAGARLALLRQGGRRAAIVSHGQVLLLLTMLIHIEENSTQTTLWMVI